MALLAGLVVSGVFASAHSVSANEYQQTKLYSSQNINVNKKPNLENSSSFKNALPPPTSMALENIDPAAGDVMADGEFKLEVPNGYVTIEENRIVPSGAPEELSADKLEKITEIILAEEALPIDERAAIIWDENQVVEVTEFVENSDVDLEQPQEILNIKETSSINEAYQLVPDDELRIVVFGENDLSGRFKVSNDGSISVPLIGSLDVTGLSPRDVEDLIEERLRDGYIKNPSVSIEMQTTRPFYILGEVRSPGRYDYVPDMNVLKAVAISGGYTYRANKKKIDIVRGNAGATDPVTVSSEEIILPGDVIYVRERFF